MTDTLILTFNFIHINITTPQENKTPRQKHPKKLENYSILKIRPKVSERELELKKLGGPH